jgi:hypothetical protein
VLNNTAPTVGTVFTLIRNTGGAAIANPPLTNAPESGSISINGRTAVYTYHGSPGANSFTLTVVSPAPPPSGSGQLKRELNGTELPFFVGGVLQDSRPLSSITTIAVNGTAPVALTLDYTSGVLPKRITYDGGTNGTLTEIGSLGVTTTEGIAGFDIFGL